VVESGGFQHGHTYAGNPMACTVGLEVMNVIRDEGLCDNAAAMGAVLKEGLLALAKRHPVIGDVRGRGLLLGIELVKDRDTREPFPAEKNMNLRLTAECRKQGLILYPRRCINGLAGDHLTVAPPLIVGQNQVNDILNRLDAALARLAP
jgi:adenosylmethionine-8-amino-7-oxononanoate aminotransferase